MFEIETIDIGSIDTGRGSSIASSPPEYFPDSPLNVEDVKNKTKFVDSGTSPPRLEFRNSAVSPILFEPLSPTRKPKIIITDNSTNHRIMVDKAVSPIKYTDSLKFSKSANDQTNSVSHNDKIPKRDLHEDINDREIELIFRNMRFEHNLITPLPISPSKLNDVENRSLSTIFESCESADLAKLHDENKKLQSNMVLIKKEMMKLKRFVQNMGLEGQFDGFMDVPLINDINAMGTVALEIAQIKNSVSPVHSIARDDNITLDLDVYEDHVTDVIPPVNNDVLLAEQGETVLATLKEEQGFSNVECTEHYQLSSCKDYEASKKGTKARKLSKLDKIRKRMLPKSKIRRIGGPPKRLLRSMTKRLSPYSRSSPILSEQQEAYAKAVFIWKQMNAKKKVTHEKGNATPSLSTKTKKPNEDENKTQSKNYLFSNNWPATSMKSKPRSEKESYGIKTRKSSITLQNGSLADHNNVNSLNTDEALFVVSLSEKVQSLQKGHANIPNTANNTVQLPRDAKWPKVNPTETRPKIILRSSSTTERSEDNENKSKTGNVVLRSDLKSPIKNEHEGIKVQRRKSLRRPSQEASASNDKDTLNENLKSPERRGRLKHLNKTPCKRILRSSNQLPDSPNNHESKKLGSSIPDKNTKQHRVSYQGQGCQSTSTDDTLIWNVTNSRTSSLIQQSDKNATQEDRDNIDNDTLYLERKGRKRKSQDIPAKQNKISLRSSAVLQPSNINNDEMEANSSSVTCNAVSLKSVIDDTEKESKRNLRNNRQQYDLENIADNRNVSDHTETNATTSEKDSFNLTLEKPSNKHSNQVTCPEVCEKPKKNDNAKQNHENDTCVNHTRNVPQNSILCKAIEKYGRNHDINTMKKLPGNYFFHVYCVYMVFFGGTYITTYVFCFQMLCLRQSVRSWKPALSKLLNYLDENVFKE